MWWCGWRVVLLRCAAAATASSAADGAGHEQSIAGVARRETAGAQCTFLRLVRPRQRSSNYATAVALFPHLLPLRRCSKCPHPERHIHTEAATAAGTEYVAKPPSTCPSCSAQQQRPARSPRSSGQCGVYPPAATAASHFHHRRPLSPSLPAMAATASHAVPRRTASPPNPRPYSVLRKSPPFGTTCLPAHSTAAPPSQSSRPCVLCAALLLRTGPAEYGVR